ncbi:MAG: hypothetical protein NT118_09200, partial [Lentisphaerae bacterium]|nr:hypothetical protein [Lentisphaerota bacterium]
TELVDFFPEGEKKNESENRRDGESEKSGRSCTAADCLELVWNHAGVLGVDPGPFTLRELSLLAKSRKKESWHRISAVLAQNHNMNRTSNADPVRSPDDYNPYAEHKEETRIVDTKLAFSIMKEIWRGK